MNLIDLIKERLVNLSEGLVDPFGLRRLVSEEPVIQVASEEETLWGFTLEQIRAATKAQIVTKITNKLQNMTKKQIIMLVMEVVNVSRKPEITYRPDGQIESRLEVMEDVLGQKVGSTRIEWIYYGTGEIDIITIIDQDINDAEIERRTIKHFLDDRQPIMYWN